MPFVPPTVKDTSLPYWLYPVVGLVFIAFSALLWYFQVVLYGGLEKSVYVLDYVYFFFYSVIVSFGMGKEEHI